MTAPPTPTPFDSAALEAALAPWRSARRWWVAFSGGLDSTVLLHLLCSQRSAGQTPPISAVHINHQLHPAAEQWQQRAGVFCAALDVPLEVCTVSVRQTGSGLEAAAREARYTALEPLLEAGDVMFFAHHQDDQVETVLLRWLRGAGLRGLQGMPQRRALGRGQLARPLLGHPRSALQAYAVAEGLNWIDDPSNVDTSLDRNYLRHTVLPAIAERWPGYRGSVERSAQQLGAAEGVLENLLPAPKAVTSVFGDPGLDLHDLLARPGAAGAMALRGWLEDAGLPLPPGATVTEFLRQLHAGGGSPLLTWQGYALRRFGDGVFLLPPARERDAGGAQLAPGTSLQFGGGQLSLVPAGHDAGIRLPQGSALTVHWRRGGERCRLPGRAGSRRLKTLLQEAGIPPWWRDDIPLLYHDGALVAVADLWVCDGSWLVRDGGKEVWRVRWRRNTDARAIEL